LSSPFFCYLVPLLPQHPVFEHPQSTLHPQCERPSFTNIQNNRQNYRSVCSINATHTRALFKCGAHFQDRRQNERRCRKSGTFSVINALNGYTCFHMPAYFSSSIISHFLIPYSSVVEPLHI
jgi:hypothetical protein